MNRLLLCFFIIAILFKEKAGDYSYEIMLPSEPAVFGLEDLEGRLNYERMLTVSPETGKIPDNIRLKELAFARKRDGETKNLRKQNLDIQSAGPSNVGGRTRAISLDVRNENVMLAGGVSGGIWKSTDGGLSWERKSDPENRNSVTCIVQDTRTGREDTWYHGTGELVGSSARGGGAPFRGDGIFKSTDNGESWEVIPTTAEAEPAVFSSQFQYIWDIEINDQNLVQDELIVAAFGGILRSIDGGNSWSVELGQELFNLPSDTNLNEVNASFFSSLEKTSAGVFYAALSTFSSPDGNSPDGGIFVSEDAQNWFPIDPFTPGSTYRRIVMGHAPSDPRQCYVLVDSSPTFLLRYTLISFGGVNGRPVGTWSDLLEVPAFGGNLGDYDAQGSYNMVVKVDPRNVNTVFVGGTNLYRSTDGFETQENIDWIGGYDPEGSTSVYLNHHPDQHDLVFFPSDPNKMISTNDGGVRLTNNFNADSVTWESRNAGYQTSQFFTIALSQETDDVVLGGMQDNGTDISFGGVNWSGLLGGDGGYAETTRGKQYWYTSFQNGQTLSLTLNEESNITSFARVDPAGLVAGSGDAFLFINPFLVDPTLPTRMFMAGGRSLYVNENVAQILPGTQDASDQGWTRLGDVILTGASISSMDISSDGTVLYYGTSGGELFKLTNADRTLAIEINFITPAIFPQGYVSSISVNPEDPDHLLVIFSNYEIPSIFESVDGGDTFQDVSGNLEEFEDGSGNGPSVRWGEIIPTNSGNLYVVGTSIGLYTSETTSASTVWLKESSELIGSSVIPMLDYRPTDGKLAIATHGNGVFMTTIDDFKSLEPTSDSEAFQIVSAYPSPFFDSTTIEFSIPEDGIVKIDLYSAQGQLIKNLLWAPQFSGTSSVTWDGTNANGTSVLNGVYFYRILYNGSHRSGRIALIR